MSFIILFKSSRAKQIAQQGIEYILPPNRSVDLCPFFCFYPSSLRECAEPGGVWQEITCGGPGGSSLLHEQLLVVHELTPSADLPCTNQQASSTLYISNQIVDLHFFHTVYRILESFGQILPKYSNLFEISQGSQTPGSKISWGHKPQGINNPGDSAPIFLNFCIGL